MIPFVCRRILKRRQKCYDSLNCQMCHRLRSIHAPYVAYVHKVHTFTFGTMFGQYLPSCRRTYIVHAVHVVSRQGHATAQNTKKFGHYAFVVNCCQVFAHYRIARARSLYNNWFSFKIGLKCGAHTHGDANRFIEAKIARTIFFFIHISSYFFFFFLLILAVRIIGLLRVAKFVQISFMDEVLLFVCVYWTNALIVFQRRHGWMHVVDACPLRPQTLCLCMQ